MPNLTTGLPRRTGDLEKDYDNLYKWAVSLVEELKYIFCNLDSGNFAAAESSIMRASLTPQADTDDGKDNIGQET